MPANFSEQHVEETKNIDCGSRIAKLEKEVYKTVALKFRTDTDFGVHTNCIMADLRTHTWFEEVMKWKVYSMSYSMPENETKQKISEADVRIERTLEDAIMSCLFKKALHNMSDKAINDMDDGFNKMGKYCARQRVIELHLIDDKLVKNIAINPDHLDTEGINCDAVLDGKFADFAKKLHSNLKGDSHFKKEAFDCFIKKFKEGQFYNKYLALVVYSELSLAAEKKSIEVNRFGTFMSDLSESVAECK